MQDLIEDRSERLRAFFELGADARLIEPENARLELRPEAAEGLRHFHIEWHVIPSAALLPLDDSYTARLYSRAPRDFAKPREHSQSYREQLIAGHRKHQGRLIGIETTVKPHYLPENRQFYGS